MANPIILQGYLMFEREQEQITNEIRSILAQHPYPKAKIEWNPIPFAGKWGISTSFFQLAAQWAREQRAAGHTPLPVPQLAAQIASRVRELLSLPSGFQRVEAVNGYLNLYFDPLEFTRRVVDTVLEQGERFGWGEPTGKRILVEFSQPNTHKAFHVGHLRNVVLGDALCNILEAAGNEVIRANYINDTGLHVIKWLWNYQKYHAGEEPGEDKTRWMGDLYAEANRRLEENPELESEVRQLYARWDQRDPEILALWEKSRQWSLEGFEQIYAILGVRFDHIFYDHELEKPGQELVEELVRKGIAIDERPRGPVIVRIDELLGLEKETYRVLVILRSDGTSLYSTKDLVLALKKFELFNPDLSVYVVDVRQSLYLQQIYKTLALMGHPDWAERCYHFSYEVVNLPGNVTIASREGTVVLLEDLIREARQRALEVVREKNPHLSAQEMEEVARVVALGAIKYPMLARDATKIVTFDWNAALDFNGQAAPYIQYAHVRANSILRKMETPLPPSVLPTYELHPTEIQLIDWISRLPGEVQKAAQEMRPLYLTNLAYELARAFNDFYAECPVLKADENMRAARLRLVAAAKQALANLLRMLGIVPPEVM
ncbi:MAG: arginine--tRNA ligase [Anaerolineales bacterium]|nr:arginine--tRNA ligase [Anaerolineales bacterium]MDW8161184.1 arginine--tRNA ligase [Anaerolineales bacterium]